MWYKLVDFKYPKFINKIIGQLIYNDIWKLEILDIRLIFEIFNATWFIFNSLNNHSYTYCDFYNEIYNYSEIKKIINRESFVKDLISYIDKCIYTDGLQDSSYFKYLYIILDTLENKETFGVKYNMVITEPGTYQEPKTLYCDGEPHPPPPPTWWGGGQALLFCTFRKTPCKRPFFKRAF